MEKLRYGDGIEGKNKARQLAQVLGNVVLLSEGWSNSVKDSQLVLKKAGRQLPAATILICRLHILIIPQLRPSMYY